MNLEMRIGRLQAEDLDSILKLEESLDPTVHAKWDRSSFEQEFKIHSSFIWGVKSDQQLLSYLIVRVILDELHIINVAVLRSMQNQGIGRFLLTSILDKYRSQNIKQVLLEVSELNVNAISLYKSLGFSQYSVREKYYAHNQSNALLFKLCL